MAETNGSADKAATEAPTPPKMQILGQFIRDLSFENIAAQKSIQAQVQPEIKVQVGLDARKRQVETQYDVVVKLKVESTAPGEKPEKIFLIELDYAGIFNIENIPEEQLHPFLMIECPRMLFPFIRRVVSDITRDGGFPPLSLENIDFLAIYRNELAKRSNEKRADA